MFAFEPCRVFDHFPSAILRHAGWVEDAVVVLYPGHVAIQEEEVVVVRVVLVAETLVDFTDQVEIAVALGPLPVIIVAILVVAIAIHGVAVAVVVSWAPCLAMFLLSRLESQAADAL